MNLYLSGSNRKENCYTILEQLKSEEDILISVHNKNIQYCKGCNVCQEKEKCIIQDDMHEIYDALANTKNIIIATPIYFNQITGLLKNIIDRFNASFNVLKGKTIYLITIGALSEEENVEVIKNINNYFQELCEIFECDFVFLRNFTSKEEDNVEMNYMDYQEIIQKLKELIS